jgi:hypothetical protein
MLRHVSNQVLSCFNGDKRKYCQDLYSSPTAPVKNEYLYSQLSAAVEDFCPDIILTSSENRYLSIISTEISPQPLLIFMEAAPLPQWARKSRVYLDFFGHQSNSLLARRWGDILVELYTPMELKWAEDFLNQLDAKAMKDDENFNSCDLLQRIDTNRETIVVALQPDDWLSWEGAASDQSNPIEFLDQCCDVFNEYNIIPTFHRDTKGINEDVLFELKKRFPHVIDLPLSFVQSSTEYILPVVDHLITRSSSTGISALLYGKSLISDSRSYLSGAAISSEDFLQGKRNALTREQRLALAAFLLGRYCKELKDFKSLDDFKIHRQALQLKGNRNDSKKGLDANA